MLFFLTSFVSILFDLTSFAIIARILLSWTRSPGAGPIKMFIYDITEPILGPFRRPVFRIGVIDISPIIVLLLLDVCKSLLIYILAYLSQTL